MRRTIHLLSLIVAMLLTCDHAMAQKELVVNGDFEGSDFSSFVFHNSSVSEEFQEITNSNIVVENGNHYLKLVSQEKVENTWDTQFAIKLQEGETLPPGTIVQFSMRVRASQSTTITTQGHDEPGDYLCWGVFDDIRVSTEWKTVSGIYEIPANDVENAVALSVVRTIAFDLNYDKEHSIEFYFDDISIVVNDAQQFWWGYYQESDGFDGMLGSGTIENHDAAIFIPADHFIAGDGTIKGIRIWIRGAFDFSSVSEIKVWISKTLPEKPTDADYVQDVSVELLKEGVNDIMLNTPYDVREQAIYVGYSFILTDWEYPINISGEWEENSCFYRSSINNPEWDVYQGGKLMLQVLLDDVDLSDDAAIVSDFGTHYVEQGSSVEVPVKISNVGSNPITSLSYTIITNGVASKEQTIQLNGITFNNSTKITIPFPADDAARRHDKTLTITKVNSHANGALDKIAEGSLITISEKPVVVPVVEEFTGTWCGWCPIGMDGLEKAKEAYGDRVVLISIHSGDVMQTNDYAPILRNVGGFPSSHVNRIYDVYPEASQLKQAINQELEKITLGVIDVEATWTSNAQTAIQIDTHTKFVYSDENTQYGIAYVLVEDGLKGTGAGWAQANYLSQDENYIDFTFWYNAPSKVTGLEFNHVAVGAWNIEEDDKSPLKSDFSNGEVMDGSFLADISTNNLIQDKSKLTVVALLIDRKTGKIVNAAKCKITPTESVKIGSAKQVPYCSDKNLDFTNLPDLKAYVATGYDKAKGTIWLTRVKQVPAETGFLLMGDPDDYDIPTIEGLSDVYYKNMFKGTLEGTTLYTTDGDYTNYYLSNGDYGVGFYKVGSSVALKANRAYLSIPTDIPANGSEGDTEVIKVSAAKQVPYFTSKNLDFSTMEAKGVKAYTATGYNYKTGIIWLTRVKKVPAQTGILVMADKEGEYNVPTTSVQSIYENMFTGSETAQTIYTTETDGDITYINYYLSNGESGVGFYKVTKEDGVKMGANRSYLQIPKREKASGARGMSGNASFCKMIISDNDDDVIAIPIYGEGTTGIIESGITNPLQQEEVWYTLQGIRVDKPGKGLYIRNGKTVLIK